MNEDQHQLIIDIPPNVSDELATMAMLEQVIAYRVQYSHLSKEEVTRIAKWFGDKFSVGVAEHD